MVSADPASAGSTTDVGDDDLFLAQAAQAAEHRRQRQPNLVGMDSRGLEIVVPHQHQQPPIELVEVGYFPHEFAKNAKIGRTARSISAPIAAFAGVEMIRPGRHFSSSAGPNEGDMR